VQASPSLVVFIDAIEISIYVSISDEKRKKSPESKRGVENIAPCSYANKCENTAPRKSMYLNSENSIRVQQNGEK
jgi:hypothetical protein